MTPIGVAIQFSSIFSVHFTALVQLTDTSMASAVPRGRYLFWYGRQAKHRRPWESDKPLTLNPSLSTNQRGTSRLPAHILLLELRAMGKL